VKVDPVKVEMEKKQTNRRELLKRFSLGAVVAGTAGL
jgi:hypothetical protein